MQTDFPPTDTPKDPLNPPDDDRREEDIEERHGRISQGVIPEPPKPGKEAPRIETLNDKRVPACVPRWRRPGHV